MTSKINKEGTGALSRLYLSDDSGTKFTSVLDDLLYDTEFQAPSPMKDGQVSAILNRLLFIIYIPSDC